MSHHKRDAIDMMKELVELTILDEGDPQSFRVRAYEQAMAALEAFEGDLGSMKASELTKLKGIGKSTAEKLRELFETGRVTKLEGLRAKHPASVVALMKIPGLGPKAVARLRAELGVVDLDTLKAAVREQKIRALKGFGQKTEENLTRVLERLERDGGEKRTPLSVALPLAERLVGELRSVPGVQHVQYCGSLRRFSETVGDLDIVVAAETPSLVFDRLVSLPVFESVIVRGEKKTSMRTRRGLQVDCRVVAKRELGAALMYFTGSKGHNIRLRQRALDRGWTLNEYALSEIESGKIVAQETEEAIYDALGLAWIPPHLREDGGEIELAERRALPKPIDGTALMGDFHVHTTLSGDGRSSLDDMLNHARERGYKVVAITEHAEDLAMSGVSREKLLDQREKIRAAQAAHGDALRILHGVELNIGKDGSLDYDPAFRETFDFCLASVHEHFDLGRDAQTARIVRAMEDPAVNMIGHLSARMIGARPGIELDMAKVFDAAERTGTAIEINGSLPRLDASASVVRDAKSRDITFVLTSDAHHTTELDQIQNARMVAEKSTIDPSRIANTWSAAKILQWVAG
ncbi:MAG: DNA polymerase/3'-5' exonuclease PolX [Polyangiaceae bacterium]